MKKVIITAGGTSERIDNVRKITNSSSGKLGVVIANTILKEMNDAEIYYICSKTALRPTNKRVSVVEIDGVIDLKRKVESLLTTQKIDFFIHSMAVSDYMTDYISTIDDIKSSILKNDNLDEAFANVEKLNGSKISSYKDNLVIVLKPTPKIISMIKSLSPATFLVGFKLLDGVSRDELISVAKGLMQKNNCDLVVANDLVDIRAGEHIAYIVDRQDGISVAHGKDAIAKKLVRRMKNEE